MLDGLLPPLPSYYSNRQQAAASAQRKASLHQVNISLQRIHILFTAAINFDNNHIWILGLFKPLMNRNARYPWTINEKVEPSPLNLALYVAWHWSFQKRLKPWILCISDLWLRYSNLNSFWELGTLFRFAVSHRIPEIQCLSIGVVQTGRHKETPLQGFCLYQWWRTHNR